MTDGALPYRLLRAHLAARAPAREAFVARLFVACTVGALVIVISLAPADRRHVIAVHLPYFLVPVAYHLVLLAALHRGWYHPVVPWLDAIVQTSLLALPFYFAVHDDGVSAVGDVIPVGWVTLVALSALKANPAISVGAGVVAGLEYIAISLTTGASLSAEQRSEVITIGAFFVLAGVVAAGVATYVIRQAQEALHAVRDQDLMGKYFMHERLGAGGMAEVFRATYSPEGGFEKIVAVKRVLPEVADAADGRIFLDMFREEAQLCAQLSHPNVVQVLDAGRFAGRYVLTMEYIDGLSLHRVIERSDRPLAIAAITYVGAELAAALDYIHGRVDANGASLGLVHRDVNPPNVLVSRLGEVKLADFGVAHAVGRASLDPDRVYGKLGYLAPEQLQADAIDGRADLFALGLTLYEMVVGKPMFSGDSMWEAADVRRPELELAGCARASEVPAELVRLICDLLAMAPELRPASGAAVRARLLSLSGAAAPFPSGQIELAGMVRSALDHPASEPARPDTAATIANTRPSSTTKRGLSR